MFPIVGLALIFGLWARYHFTNATVKEDPTSAPNLAAATEAAQPLLQALEKYHDDNGLYPTTLDSLTAAHAPSLGRRDGFLYSARTADWVFKSDTCAAREKDLHGWILKETREYQGKIDEFKQECVTGYRYYQLQSGDFPRDAHTQYIERWAYFDSRPRQWSLGWCAKNGRRNQEIGMNGICRWQQHGAPAVW
ncbi:MAG: hypothetical protein ACLPHP_05315 [Candidatus Sulfotelmatobacter sp.]